MLSDVFRRYLKLLQAEAVIITLKEARTASYHTVSSSLFTVELKIQCYGLQMVENW
jgi:hypothetical protein